MVFIEIQIFLSGQNSDFLEKQHRTTFAISWRFLVQKQHIYKHFVANYTKQRTELFFYISFVVLLKYSFSRMAKTANISKNNIKWHLLYQTVEILEYQKSKNDVHKGAFINHMTPKSVHFYPLPPRDSTMTLAFTPSPPYDASSTRKMYSRDKS